MGCEPLLCSEMNWRTQSAANRRLAKDIVWRWMVRAAPSETRRNGHGAQPPVTLLTPGDFEAAGKNPAAHCATGSGVRSAR
jgi:hypothetical protein